MQGWGRFHKDVELFCYYKPGAIRIYERQPRLPLLLHEALAVGPVSATIGFRGVGVVLG